MSRKTPYTEIGIRRLLCFRCKKNKSEQQWQVCADNNIFRPLCWPCDLELNRLVLDWAGYSNAEELIKKYENDYGRNP